MSITLTGTFTRLDGEPATGTVKITPSRSPILDSTGKVIISGPQVFPLDKDGKLTTEIPASNDPDLGPPFTYTVEALLSHKPWKISKVWIPYGSTTVDLSEISDYQPVPGVATRTVTIPADGADGQVLVWDGAGFSWMDSNIDEQLALAQQLHDNQAAIAGLTGEDTAVAYLIGDENSATHMALDNGYVGATDARIAASESGPTLGAPLSMSAGWTLGTGWTGDPATGFTHTEGSTDTLTGPTIPAGQWLVTFTSSATIGAEGDLSVRVGDGADAYLYASNGGAGPYRVGFSTTVAGPVVFTPLASFAGTVTEISVQPITGAAAPALTITDTESVSAFEVRPTLMSSNNLFMGRSVGRFTTGERNVGVGVAALIENSSGYWNTAFGTEVLNHNTHGNRNVAVGMRALSDNVGGYRNTAVGQSTMRRNTVGHSNTTLGADTLYRAIDGSYNVAIGLSAMSSTRHGNRNVAIGYSAMASSETDNSVGVGRMALYRVKGTGNTGVGDHAGAFIDTGNNNTAVGEGAVQYAYEGSANTGVGAGAAEGASYPANFNRVTAVGRNAANGATSSTNEVVAVGHQAIQRLTGDRNIGIGMNALRGGLTGATGLRNVGIGYEAGHQVTTGAFNAIIGTSAAISLTTGSNNVLVGSSTAPNLTSGSENTVIGHGAGSQLTTGTRNILVGFGANAGDDSYKMNIGNALYGDLHAARRSVGVGIEPTARLEIMAPSATLPPVKLNHGALVTTPQAGALEYDGTSLYFTDSTGTRRELAVVE